MTNTITPEHTATIRDAVRSMGHWADQTHRARTAADRIAAALADMPADHPRRQHLETELHTLTQRAIRSNNATEHARVRLTLATTVRIALPGGFCDYFEGSGVAQGQDQNDPECAATYAAWTNATHRRYGRTGYTMTLDVNDMGVLNVLEDYVGFCLEANADDPRPSEIKGANTLAQRIKEARAQLAPLLAVRQEAEQSEAEYRAYYAATFAVTPQEAQEGPQTAQEAPAAPQEQQEATTAAQGPQEAAPTGERFHLRTVNGGQPERIPTREALAEINDAMIGPGKRDVREMSEGRGHARIAYRDGRTVTLTPATA